jgi:signal transduction histidine kinase
MIKTRFQGLVKWVQRYPVIVATVAILGYYTTTALDLFSKSGKTHLTFMDFFVQFDSLIWMWLVAFVFIKLQQTKEKVYSEEREKLSLQYQLDKSKIASSLLRDITKQLQDTINNPLAVISVTTEDIRKRFVSDPEILRRLDQIDASMQRIHHAIKDIANYQSAKVLETLQRGQSETTTTIV